LQKRIAALTIHSINSLSDWFSHNEIIRPLNGSTYFLN